MNEAIILPWKRIGTPRQTVPSASGPWHAQDSTPARDVSNSNRQADPPFREDLRYPACTDRPASVAPACTPADLGGTTRPAPAHSLPRRYIAGPLPVCFSTRYPGFDAAAAPLPTARSNRYDPE